MPLAKPPAARWMDRLFLAGCTAAYAVLVGSVFAALTIYGR